MSCIGQGYFIVPIRLVKELLGYSTYRMFADPDQRPEFKPPKPRRKPTRKVTRVGTLAKLQIAQ